MSTQLETYLEAAAGDLPAIPTIAARVMQAVDDPNTSRDHLQALIEQDASLASRVLAVSNSVMYGYSGRVETLNQAIGLVGSRVVRNLVLGISLQSVFRRFDLMEKLLWTHSTLAGPVTEAVARSLGTGIDTDGAFTAGLLHDIGKSALANSHHDEYEQVVARVYNDKISFVEAERDQFGFDHAELGAMIAVKWNLPPHLIHVIRNHHSPDAAGDPGKEVGYLTLMVSLATACLTQQGVGRREPARGLRIADHPAWKRLGLPDSDVEPILQVCADQITRAKTLLG
jgi:putative nucleotidyltransferase with HDIG domain